MRGRDRVFGTDTLAVESDLEQKVLFLSLLGIKRRFKRDRQGAEVEEVALFGLSKRLRTPQGESYDCVL